MKQHGPAYHLISLAICAAVLLALSSCTNPQPDPQPNPNIETELAPATPAGLSAATPTIKSLNVSWTSVSDSTSYQVCRDTSSGGAFATVAYDGATTSFIDSGLKSGITYYYKVKATNSIGSSALSVAAAGSTLAFAYVVNYGGPTVSAFAINGTTGALTEVTGSPFTSVPKAIFYRNSDGSS